MTDSTEPASPPSPLPIPPPLPPPPPDRQPPKAGWLLMLGTILALLINITLATINGRLKCKDSSELMGYVVGAALLLPLIVVAISAIWPKMRNNRAHLLVFFITSAVSIFSTANTIGQEMMKRQPHAASRTVAARDAFTATFPNTTSWKKVSDGPLNDQSPNSHSIAFADFKRKIQLSIIVMPTDMPSSGRMKEKGKIEWEEGVLKNATRKKSSENIRINGCDAYKLIFIKDLPDGQSFEVTVIMLVENGWIFNLGITVPAGSPDTIPEITQFLDSFRIGDPPPGGDHRGG